MESLNGEVLSGMGSPLVKVARESTSNDLTDSGGVIRVAEAVQTHYQHITSVQVSRGSVFIRPGWLIQATRFEHSKQA